MSTVVGPSTWRPNVTLRLSSSEPAETTAAAQISLAPDGQSVAYQLAFMVCNEMQSGC